MAIPCRHGNIGLVDVVVLQWRNIIACVCCVVSYYHTIIIGHNLTSTGNNIASLQYNNSNRTDVAMPAGCCHDAEARRKTQR